MMVPLPRLRAIAGERCAERIAVMGGNERSVGLHSLIPVQQRHAYFFDAWLNMMQRSPDMRFGISCGIRPM